MIISFGNTDTEKIWNGIRVPNIPNEIQQLGRRKLRILNNSTDMNDLRIPPGNRLKRLSGRLNDHYSIRINDQWRLIFEWKLGEAKNVIITDYH